MKNKKILIGFTFHAISLVLSLVFVFIITNTENSKDLSYDYLNEETLNVSSFITDSETVKENNKEILKEFLENVLEERNNAINSGNVDNLCKYYDIATPEGANSLEREFKRIAYFRDWMNEKNNLMDDIDSDITITSLKEKDDVIKLTFNEKFSFDFASKKTPKKEHKFSHNLVHTLTIKSLGNNSFIISSDYYDDFLNGELDKYNFDLSEKTLIPTTKSKKNLNLLIN